MPIFARTKMVIQDDCLSPAPGSTFPGRPYIIINYSGPNPHKVYPMIKKLMNQVMGIDERDIQEKEINWNRGSPTEKFKIKIEGYKDLDKFSYLYIELDISGTSKPSKDFEKEGNVTIKLTPHLRTEYPQDTLWQRSLFYEFFRMLFHKFIYKSTRQRYLEECRNLSIKFEVELKRFLNLLGGE